MPQHAYIEDRYDQPVEKDDSETGICKRPPRNGKRTGYECNLSPVERDQAHCHAACSSEDLINLDVVGGNPGDPGEKAQGREEVGGDEICTLV